MKQKKESFFWTSYADLMTSLFVIMLVLFVVAIIVMSRQTRATLRQLEEVRTIAKSTEELAGQYFQYNRQFKKYQLKVKVQFPLSKWRISTLPSSTRDELRSAGRQVIDFLRQNRAYKYILIVEGQASKDSHSSSSMSNYELSYKRALSLVDFWISACGLKIGDNCELQIAGSGDNALELNTLRDGDNRENQRFLIHILPKNIIE